MNNEDFQALARQGALDALKALAAIAVDPNVVASDREYARSMVELRLEQASNDIPPDVGPRSPYTTMSIQIASIIPEAKREAGLDGG